jgi:hypothetical protein
MQRLGRQCHSKHRVVKFVLLDLQGHNPWVEIAGIGWWFRLGLGLGFRLRNDIGFRLWFRILTVQVFATTVTENAASWASNL